MVRGKYFYIDHKDVLHVVTGEFPDEIYEWDDRWCVYYTSDPHGGGHINYDKYHAAVAERRKKLQLLKDTAIPLDNQENILLAEELLWYLRKKYASPTHENFKKFFPPNEFYESKFTYYYKKKENIVDALDNGIRYWTAIVSLEDKEDIITQLVNDPQVKFEKETDIWKSIFEDGWYATDNLELKIGRLFQDFEIKRRK